MGQIASLFASLTLQSSQFTSGLRQASAQANTAAATIGGAMGRVGAITATALAGIGVAAVAGFGIAAKSAFDYASSLTELAQQTGTTVEQYQILSLAAKGAGAEQATLDTALKRLNATLGEARNGSKSAIEAFKSIGLKPEQLASLERGGDLMPTIMEGLQNVGTAAEQAAAAKRLFGKAAGELLPLLTSGAEGYNSVAQEAQAMGLITEEQAARADEAADKMGVLGFAIQTRLGGAIADTVPMIMSLVNWVAELIVSIGNGLRELQVFAYKAALVQNQFETGIDATVAFLRADNPIQGVRDAKASNARHRARRDRLQGTLDGIERPNPNDALGARFRRIRRSRGGASVLDLDEADLGAANRRGGGPKPKRGGGGGGGMDPLRAAKDLVTSLKFEAEQLERNEREQEVYNNLKRAGVDATSAFGIEIRKLTEDLLDAKGLKEYNKWLEETIENTKLAGRLIGLNDRDKLREETIQEIMAKRPKGAAKGEGNDIIIGGKPKLSDDEQRLLDERLGNFDKQAGFDRRKEAEEQYVRDYQAWVEEIYSEEREHWQAREQHYREIGERFADIGQEMLDGLIFGTKSFKDAMSDALMQLGQLMLEELVYKPLREMIVSGIANMLMSFAGGGNFSPGFLGSDYGTPSWANGSTGPKGMAHGGPVGAGSPFWVGEKGPELFTPAVDGRIIPNHRFRGGSAPTINVDARGATDPAAVRKAAQEAIAQAMPMITEAAHSKTVRKLARPRLG